MPILLDQIQIQPSEPPPPLDLYWGSRDPRSNRLPLMPVTIKEEPLYEQEASSQVEHSLLRPYPMGSSMNNAFILYHINNSCIHVLVHEAIRVSVSTAICFTYEIVLLFDDL